MKVILAFIRVNYLFTVLLLCAVFISSKGNSSEKKQDLSKINQDELLPSTRETFAGALKQFENSKDNFVNEMTDSTELFNKCLQNAEAENPDFARLRNSFYVVAEKVNILKKDFRRVVTDADVLYAAFSIHAKRIKNKAKREKIEQRISSKKAEYIQNLKESRNALDLLGPILDEVQDNIYYLEISYSLDAVEEMIKEMDIKTKEIDPIIKELNKLLQSSKELLKSTGYRVND